MSDRTDKTYLGDGVYAEFDGYHIWLNTGTAFEIALEPAVYAALIKYYSDLVEKYRAR